ncbi:glycosyltransferase [Candidatus Woesebacteria bacterium]|nr:glycosyltransferase [Candidatus Woesebacteria bacterium]
METSITISNNSSNNAQSQIRGLGRYVDALRKTLDDKNIRGVFINPFFNVIARPEISAELFSKSQKKIAVIHDIIPLKFPQFPWVGVKGRVWTVLNRLLLRFFDLVVTDSNTSKDDIIRVLHVPIAKVHVAYPYSSLQEIDPQETPKMLPYDLKPNTYLIYVGDVNWHKNIVSVARAAIAANTQLVCVGGAFVERVQNHPWLKDLQDFLGLARQHSDIIITTGFIDDLILATLYQNALANILISLDEGFGYSYVEAAHFCTPSILSDAPIFHEISGDKGAVFVNPTDIEQIVDQIVTMQRDPQHREKLGQEARDRSAHYSIGAFRKQWAELLHV